MVRASSLNWSMAVAKVTKVADATKVASKVIKMAKLMVELLVVLSFATPAVSERCFKEVPLAERKVFFYHGKATQLKILTGSGEESR